MALDPSITTPDTDPTAGGAPPEPTAGASTGTTTPGGAAPTSERTFTQAEIDRIVQDRLDRDRRSRQAPTPASTGDIPSWAAPIMRQNAVNDVRWQVQQMREQYKDFAANETPILEMAARFAEENPGISPTAALQFAYRTFGHEQLSKVDIDAVKKQAADEAVKKYLAKKTGTAASTPKPEGPGGTAASASADLKSADAARKWAVQHLEQATEA